MARRSRGRVVRYRCERMPKCCGKLTLVQLYVHFVTCVCGVPVLFERLLIRVMSGQHFPLSRYTYTSIPLTIRSQQPA